MFINCKLGRNIIEPYLCMKVRESSSKLKDQYKVEKHQFQVEAKKENIVYSDKYIVFADAKELINSVASKRGHKEIHTKVYCDGGGGFLKLSASIIPTSKDLNETLTNENKYSSTKKSVLLAIIKDIPETYFNIEKIFSLTNLNQCSYSFHADFKLMLITLGNMINQLIF